MAVFFAILLLLTDDIVKNKNYCFMISAKHVPLTSPTLSVPTIAIFMFRIKKGQDYLWYRINQLRKVLGKSLPGTIVLIMLLHSRIK